MDKIREAYELYMEIKPKKAESEIAYSGKKKEQKHGHEHERAGC